MIILSYSTLIIPMLKFVGLILLIEVNMKTFINPIISLFLNTDKVSSEIHKET